MDAANRAAIANFSDCSSASCALKLSPVKERSNETDRPQFAIDLLEKCFSFSRHPAELTIGPNKPVFVVIFGL